MKGRIITESIISNFKYYLQNEEKSTNTMDYVVFVIGIF